MVTIPSALVFLHLLHSLDQGAEATAAGTESVVTLVTLDIVSLPGLSPQQHDGDAGRDEQAHQKVETAALTQLLSSVVDLAAAAPVGETACSHVVAAAVGSMVPFLRHVAMLVCWLAECS